MSGNGSSRRSNAGGSDIEVLGQDFDDKHWKLDTEMVSILDEQHLPYEIVKIPIAKIDYSINQDQVRFGTDQVVMDSYTAALKREDKLPTGTVDADFKMVDIYHRLGAAIEAGLTHLVVIRITTPLTFQKRGILATIRNNRHGKRMSNEETLNWAVSAVENEGWTVDYTALAMNVDATSIRRRMADQALHKKAISLGVEDQFAGLKKTVRYTLGSAGLHDAPFKAAVKLLAESPVPVTAAKSQTLIQEIGDQPSDSKALAVIKRMKTVDLAPPTVGSPATPRSLSFDDAYKALTAGYGPFKKALTDEGIVEALLKGVPTTPKFAKVHDVLSELRPNFEKLCAHFGA